jgi:AraC-like DNA-binding protein
VEEVLEFRHSPHLMGVGVLHAHHTERKWHLVNSAFGLAVPSDWVGELSYRGRQQVFQTGDVFCTEPGEVHETSRIVRSGAFKVLLIDERPLLEHVAEIAPHLKAPHFRSMGGRMSPQLENRLNEAFRLIGGEASALHVQACMIELVASMVEELVDDPKPNRVAPVRTRTLERARECLHDGDDGWVDLETLAREAGLSRFHLLRSFKERYGLPPHAYQVGLRIAKAQCLLRKRVSPAQVAAECGFADQSHFTRHFKQALGVTPGRFARDFAGRQQ